MNSKNLKIKSRKGSNDLIFISNNDSMIELDESLKINDLMFKIEVLQEIKEGFQFKVSLTKNLQLTDFFQFVVTFLGFENKKTFDFSFSKVIGNNESMKDYKDMEIKYILFESDLDLNLKITQL